jgi:heterodisulfide reductase subunit A-like polyferredoxin
VVLALRDALLAPAAAATPPRPPRVPAEQNEQQQAAAAMAAGEAGVAATATAAAAAAAAEAAQTITTAESAVKTEEVAAEAVAKAAPSCQICFEPYGGAVVPRILVACGHTFCEGCLSTMLRCAERIIAHASYDAFGLIGTTIL